MKPLQLYKILLAIMFLLFAQNVIADDDIDDVKSKLPKLLGSTNVGNDFWFTIPPCYETSGHDNYIIISVTSMFETDVTVEVPGKGFKTTQTTVPNEVIEFNITPDIGQCYHFNPSDSAVPEQVYEGYGIHVYSGEPIIVYCVVRYYHSGDAFLALPTSTLGREYIVASYGDMGAVYSGRYPSFTGLVAAYDKTKVTFTLGGNILTETGGGMKPGNIVSKTMNKGDVWMFSSATNEGDLTGSKFVSTQPVAVVSGNYCANIPLTNKWCDYIAEMEMPAYTWGKDYHIAKIPDRLHSSIVRVFAKEANTLIIRDGKGIGYVQTAGGAITKGYLEFRLVPYGDTPRSAVISGDKPINVVLYNTGAEEDYDDDKGDVPFSMGTIPMENNYNDLIFLTHGQYGGINYGAYSFNLVFETDDPGYLPLDMEFAEVVDGEFEWQSLYSAFHPDIEDFQYEALGKKYAVARFDIYDAGVFRIRSEKPFAAYSYGVPINTDDENNEIGYGFPLGGTFMDPALAEDDKEAPVSEWVNTKMNTLTGKTVDTTTENSAIKAVFFHESASENCSFSYDEFVPGEIQELDWEVEITDPGIDATAIMTFADVHGNNKTEKIAYSGPQLELTDDIFDYGIVDLNKEYEHEYTLKNLSSDLSQHIENISLAYAGRGYSLEIPELPLELGPLQSIQIKVHFVSKNSGVYTNNLLIQGASMTYFNKELTVQASDMYKPVIVVSDISFTTDEPGESSAHDFSISNTGNDGLIIYGYTGLDDTTITTNLSEFKDGYTLNIEPGEDTSFIVTVIPDEYGEFDENIIFQSNAATADNICNIHWNVEQAPIKKVYVSDVDFEDISGLRDTTMAFYIRNTGEDVLTVNGYTGPAYDFIEISGPSLPAQVGVSKQLDFTVQISPPDQNIPEFRDTIYFDTDASEGDTMLVISAAIKSGVHDGIGYDYGISLYPLPANEFITIDNADEFFGKTMLKVNDIEGKVVIGREIVLNPGDKFKLDVSGLSTGTYMLQMEAGGKIFVGKITIER